MTTKFIKFLPVFFWMGLIYFLSSRSDLPHSSTFFLEFIFKKSGHIFVYFVLCSLWFFALGVNQWENSFLYSLIFAFTDEIHQLFVPLRTGVLTDILFDVLGITIALIFFNYFVIPKWNKNSSPQTPKRLKI